MQKQLEISHGHLTEIISAESFFAKGAKESFTNLFRMCERQPNLARKVLNELVYQPGNAAYTESHASTFLLGAIYAALLIEQLDGGELGPPEAALAVIAILESKNKHLRDLRPKDYLGPSRLHGRALTN